MDAVAGPQIVYQQRVERFAAEQQALARRFGWLAHLRLVLFGATVGLAVAGLWDLSAPRPGFLIGAGLALVGFIVAIGVHARVEARRLRAAGLMVINQQALGRLARDYDALPAPRAWPVEDSATVRDLDLAGHASLWHLLGRARTPLADRTLAAWLTEPAEPDRIGARQIAVAELAPELDLRQELQWLATDLASQPGDLDALLTWAESGAWLTKRPGLLWFARAMTVVTVALLGLDLVGLTGPSLWLLPVLINLLTTGLCLGRLNRAFSQGENANGTLWRYADLLAQAAAGPTQAPRLGELSAAMGEQAQGAQRWLRRLDRLLNLADVRRSTLAAVLAQGLFLWDFHVLDRLERWRARAGGQVRGWLTALAEFEALASLAGLAHDHPDWAVPDVAQGNDRVSAEALGHPLLSPADCVTNDVEVGPAGTCLLVTGSNMSGKSTLLRAVGVNLSLAQAGAVVCARRLATPPVQLGTSFRVTDALDKGVSYFMAELMQLKAAVERARRVAKAGARVPVFLFDEILLGTNAEERRVAVERVLHHLLDLGSFGAVATHDLSLADAEGLSDRLVLVHFREQYSEVDGQPAMSFDYRLRPGLTPTTNALKLLALVGLDEPDAQKP